MDQRVTAPVFAREGDPWLPHEDAMGPFGGLHGGAVSGLLAGELEARAAEEGLGQPVSATVYLIRPAPLAPLRTEPHVVRQGGRLSVLENSLSAGDKLQAKASVCFLKPVPVSGMAHTPETASDPSRLPAWRRHTRFDHATLLDAVEVRDEAHGDGRHTRWLRFVRPLLHAATPFADTLAIADFSTLFTAVDDTMPGRLAGWPNADLSLHLARLPQGDWIGLTSRSDWYANGMGVTETEIRDAYGPVGRSCQSVVLLPPAD